MRPSILVRAEDNAVATELMSLKLLLLLPVSLAAGIFPAAAATEAATCGYASCDDTVSDRLNVHIVCHSHDDVGWLKTVDQVPIPPNTIFPFYAYL
jgi:hypothetical protein